jgi:hypothetical protein
VIIGFLVALLAVGFLLFGYGKLRRVTPLTSDNAEWPRDGRATQP